MASGCRLERSERSPGARAGVECLCGVGCDREFQFATLAECEASIKCELAVTLTKWRLLIGQPGLWVGGQF